MAAVMAAVLAAVVAWDMPAKANQIDLSTLTCKQFQSASKDEITLILAWLTVTIAPRTTHRE